MDKNLIEQITNLVLEKVQSYSCKNTLFIIGDTKNIDLSIWKNNYEVVEDRDAKSILIATTSMELLAKIALGICDNNESLAVTKALLEDKKVFLLEKGLEFRNYKDTGRKNLFNLYLGYEKKVQELGVEIIRENKSPEVSNQYVYDASDRTDFNQKVLTEIFLIRNNIRGKKVLGLKKDCIITPLAHEYIQKNNITIFRLEGE